jgi:DNA-binding CsgD family transcriptional regulator
MGRPRWQMSDLEKVRGLASRGMTMEQIADALGISRTTLFAYKARLKDFSDAIKRGQAEGISAVANSLYESAIKGNTTAQIFYLKTRAGWVETDRHEHTGKDNAELDIVGIKSALRKLREVDEPKPVAEIWRHSRDDDSN